jgi:hypothetical protein
MNQENKSNHLLLKSGKCNTVLRLFELLHYQHTISRNRKFNTVNTKTCRYS